MPDPVRRDLSRRCLPLTKPYYLGIDLGTSSVKATVYSCDGKSCKAKKSYASQTPDGWIAAVKELTRELSRKVSGLIAAVALSSQVGTYIINGKTVISWQSDAGTEELAYIKSRISQEDFIREISMPHPDLISYPLPRLLYIQKNFGPHCQVLMPKDLLIRELAGGTSRVVAMSVCGPRSWTCLLSS